MAAMLDRISVVHLVVQKVGEMVVHLVALTADMLAALTAVRWAVELEVKSVALTVE